MEPIYRELIRDSLVEAKLRMRKSEEFLATATGVTMVLDQDEEVGLHTAVLTALNDQHRLAMRMNELVERMDRAEDEGWMEEPDRGAH